jgi:chondroitin sulfate proteoglycan 4
LVILPLLAMLLLVIILVVLVLLLRRNRKRKQKPVTLKPPASPSPSPSTPPAYNGQSQRSAAVPTVTVTPLSPSSPALDRLPPSANQGLVSNSTSLLLCSWNGVDPESSAQLIRTTPPTLQQNQYWVWLCSCCHLEEGWGSGLCTLTSIPTNPTHRYTVNHDTTVLFDLWYNQSIFYWS